MFYTDIDKLGSVAIRELALHEHKRIDKAFYLRKLTDEEFEFQLDYACFVYNGKRNIAFIRSALHRLFQS